MCRAPPQADLVEPRRSVRRAVALAAVGLSVLAGCTAEGTQVAPGRGLVRLAVCDGGGTARVEVDDAGRGVRATDRERIFERFARGPAAARGADDVGSGLGLALAAQHVELHGGRLHVEKRPGGSARFVLELPEVCP